MSDRQTTPPPVWLFSLLFVIALAIRYGIVWTAGFDGLYGQDAYYYFEEGRQFAFQFKHTGADSIGYPAMLAFITLMFGMRPEIAQTIGLLSGSLIPVLTAVLGWQLTRRVSVALIAGLLVCIVPWHIRGSIIMMSDVPAQFWLTAGAVCGVWYVQKPSWPWGLAAVITLGIAVATRYVSALTVLPMVACTVVAGVRPPWRHLAAGGVIGLIVLIPELMHMQISIPSLFLLEGWRPLNAFRSVFETNDGLLTYNWPVAVMYIKTLAGWGYMNPVWAVCALIGAWALRARRFAFVFLMMWLVVVYGFLIGLPLVNPRYLLPLVVPLSILSAVGLVTVQDDIIRNRSTARYLAIGVVLLGLTGNLFGIDRSVGEILERKRCELEMVDWIERNIAGEHLIVAFDMAHAAQHYTFHRVVHLHEIDPATLNLPEGDETGVYLIWNEAHAERVSRRRPRPDDPAPRFTENFMWLRDRVQRTRVDQVCGWEIMRINSGEQP